MRTIELLDKVDRVCTQRTAHSMSYLSDSAFNNPGRMARGPVSLVAGSLRTSKLRKKPDHPCFELQRFTGTPCPRRVRSSIQKKTITRTKKVLGGSLAVAHHPFRALVWAGGLSAHATAPTSSRIVSSDETKKVNVREDFRRSGRAHLNHCRKAGGTCGTKPFPSHCPNAISGNREQAVPRQVGNAIRFSHNGYRTLLTSSTRLAAPPSTSDSEPASISL